MSAETKSKFLVNFIAIIVISRWKTNGSMYIFLERASRKNISDIERSSKISEFPTFRLFYIRRNIRFIETSAKLNLPQQVLSYEAETEKKNEMVTLYKSSKLSFCGELPKTPSSNFSPQHMVIAIFIHTTVHTLQQTN